MNNNLSIDETIEYVQKIVENIKCAICSKTDGSRMRYHCGHTICGDCVIDAEDCQVCLTPPQTSSPKPKPDDALTQRVQNSSVLLKACQELFHTDVFKRKRLSEQLRIEKELFPECIQAPVKYENKRKSTFSSYKNKENMNATFFPGEGISPLQKNIAMENTVTYVQQWLSKNEKDFSRKPFRDLNVNTQLDNIIVPRINNKVQSKLYDNVSLLKINRKRSHFKTTISALEPNRKSTSKSNSKSKKIKKDIYQSLYKDLNETQKGCDNDESGIFMDNDPIIIDDSQEKINDKDKSAWLAVLEAHKNGEIESTSTENLDCNEGTTLNCTNKQTSTKSEVEQQSKVNKSSKVCFYKKGYITERCVYCNNEVNKGTGQPKDLEIIIDNDHFTTTIKILNNNSDHSKLNTTNSVSAQTDISETGPLNHEIDSKDGDERITNFNEKYFRGNATSPKSETRSEDLFADEGKNIANENDLNIIHNCVVIEESDSEIDINESGPLPVTVDVHRSCDESEYGILGEIVNKKDHDTRPRRGPRGLTPTSTDSSEKENYNPNRLKKHVSQKKKITKK